MPLKIPQKNLTPISLICLIDKRISVLAILLSFIPGYHWLKMIQYTIQFQLFPDKVDEFLLSWNSFCENTREAEGLDHCVMTEINDHYYEIVMNWSEKFYLNLFLNGEWNQYLQGAISVLGSENLITQKTIV